MNPIIQVEGLCKAFAGKVAVDAISFDVQAGQCFGLLGPNGAGKTTTLEMLEGLVEKDAGEIRFFGQTGQQPMDKIGIQFQNTALQDYLTCRETLQLFAAFYPQPLTPDALIELCDLGEFSEQDHRKLSGGQRQRLLLALAMVNDPDILFLDEPTTGLDPHARRNFWDLINKIKTAGKTIILTTHYMDEAEYLCDHIVLMERGKIIQRGEPQTLLAEHFPGAMILLKQQLLPATIQGKGRENGRFIELSSQDVQASLTELVAANVDLDGMQIKTANLDDLFLKLTGHALRENHV